jgi:hypothetical protein
MMMPVVHRKTPLPRSPARSGATRSRSRGDGALGFAAGGVKARRGYLVRRTRLNLRRTYLLHWMTPEATWEVDDRRARYADVTRVEFGRRYESTLALVSGARPGMVLPERAAADAEPEAPVEG